MASKRKPTVRVMPTLAQLAPYRTSTQYNIHKPLTWPHAQLVVNHYDCNAATLPMGWEKLKNLCTTATVPEVY